MSDDAIRESTTAALIDACKQDSAILAVMLFGSRARGEEHTASDTDICLVLNAGIRDPLELSKTKHAYLSMFDLDLNVFQQLPLYLRHRVLREGRVLFCRDEGRLYDLAYRTAQRFEDFRHIHESYLQEVAGGQGG